MILDKIMEYVTLMSMLSKRDLVSAADLKNEFDNISYHALLHNFKEWRSTGHLSEKRTAVDRVQRVKFGLTLKGMILIKTMFFTCLQAMDGLIGRNRIAISTEEKTIIARSTLFDGQSSSQKIEKKAPKPEKKINIPDLLERSTPQIKTVIKGAFKDTGATEFITSDMVEEISGEAAITIIDKLITILEEKESSSFTPPPISDQSIRT